MASLRELHREHQPLVSPLAHDALSARLIEHAGFKTFNIGGSALLAARYALPDLGLAGFAEMLAGIRDIVEASKLPCLVDADDGYGDVKSVVRTIQGYEAAGVSGVLLEDQGREGKQPGAASARSVVPLEVMEQKLKAAMAARQNSDFVIIGRTDAYGAEGLDAALKRAERFLRLGADGIFVAGLKTPGGLCPGWQGLQRRMELRRHLRGGRHAVAYARRTPRYGIFANRLSEHPYWARGEGDRTWPAAPGPTCCGQGQCLHGRRAGDGAEEFGRRAQFAKMERPGEKIFISLAMVEPSVDGEQETVHARCKQNE